MILGQRHSALLGCRLARVGGCFQPVAQGKESRSEAGVEHRKEPGPSGCVKKPGTSHWGQRKKYETNQITHKPIAINELRLVVRPGQDWLRGTF